MNVIINALFFLFFSYAIAQQHHLSPDFGSSECVLDLLTESEDLFSQNNYKIAIDKAITAIDYAYKLKDNALLSRSYKVLGDHYFFLLDYKPAKKTFNKALEYAIKSNDSIAILNVYNSLGNVLSDGEKKYKQGIECYNKSLSISRKVNDTIGTIHALTNLGWTYMDMQEYDKAYPFFVEAKENNDTFSDRRLDISSDIEHLIGKYHFRKKEYDKAENCFQNALTIALKNSFFFIIVDVLEERSKLYQETNYLDDAITDLKLRQIYKDSINEAKKIEALETVKAKFTLSQYEKALELAKEEKHFSEMRAELNQRRLLLAIVFSLSIMGLVYMYFSNKTRRKANETLQEKNKLLLEAKKKSDSLNALKSQFISTVSHELRTPLYGVIGIANLLCDDNELAPNQKKLVKALKQSGDFLMKNINDVLKIGEIESRKEDIKKDAIAVEQLTTGLKDKFNDTAKTNNNTLHIEINQDVPNLFVSDKLRLNEVLVNLLDNACKFTKNGNIWLRVKKCNKAKNLTVLCFEVEDDGIGISEDKKEIIFDKFYQANRGQKSLDGTGVGLSVVKYLLHTLDSEVIVDSEEGKGSRFYFKLVVDIPEEGVVIKEESEFIKRLILVAEDNKVSQTITKKMIEALGHDCVVCDNGLETFEAAKKTNFDLVFMDLNMPVMDGIDSAKNILNYNNTVPIVALTALELAEVRQQCYSVGMLHAVNKPVNKNALKEIINKYSLNTLGRTG